MKTFDQGFACGRWSVTAAMLFCAACGDDSPTTGGGGLDGSMTGTVDAGADGGFDARVLIDATIHNDAAVVHDDAGATTANLIVNGNAEAAAGSTDAAPVNTPPWTATGEATALTYGYLSYPSRGDAETPDPGPADRGNNLFIGGQADELSTLAQTISLSAYGTAIDTGHVTFTLSGWLGGFSGQSDAAMLAITFKDLSGTGIGTASIGPVTPADRQNITGLFERSTSGALPSGARSVDVLLTLTRTDGSANDGYADDLSLVLNGI